MSSPANGAGLKGNVMLYSNPEQLNSVAHAHLGLNKAPNPYRYASSAHFIPLQVCEFGLAAVNYPIVFAGDDRLPVAIMSIRPEQNLFVTSDGYFQKDAYIPAFLRRYPFILAEDPQSDRLIVCIDRAAEALAPGGDEALFADGEPTAFTQSAIEFCSNFEAERRRTNNFVALMAKYELFEVKEVAFMPSNSDGSASGRLKIADYFAVSEEKLGNLPPEIISELNSSGALSQIHAHLLSLFNWEKLMLRTLLDGPLS